MSAELRIIRLAMEAARRHNRRFECQRQESDEAWVPYDGRISESPVW